MCFQDEAERILALSGEIGDSYDTIYTMLSDVDLKFAPIKDEKGVEQPMSHGPVPFIFGKQAEGISAARLMNPCLKRIWSRLIRLLLLRFQCKKGTCCYTRARKFPSCRERALFGGDIPVSVYDVPFGGSIGKAPRCCITMLSCAKRCWDSAI